MATWISLLGLSLLIIFSSGCSSSRSAESSSQSSFAFSEESSLCTPTPLNNGVNNGVQVSARAQFLARQVSASGLLGPGLPQDIKLAEVEVLTTQGKRIQCSTTDELGQISLLIPNQPGSYVLKVSSRSDSEKYKASILNNPTANIPYSIQTTFSVLASDTNISVALPLAPYNGSLQGGAFNLLDQVYQANEFIRTNSSCPNQGAVCSSFSVAPKVRIYWTPGLSPYAYYGNPSLALSFFSKQDDPSVGLRKGIYIQGGIKGDIDCSDTDHFDNAVILHEYGHFLEDAYGKSDSPGGSHNGNGQIDPRLAWSEGWANFFQSAVFNNANYRDTIGNSNCSGGTFLGVNLNIETAQVGQDKMTSGTQTGEGVFREISISRTLWDSMDAGGPDGGAGLGFSLIWKVFSDSSYGFKNQSLHFRNIGIFNQYLRDLVNQVWPAKVTALDSALLQEYQLASQNEYALPLRPQVNASCSFNIQGVADTYQMGNWVSNLLKSNDFIQINYDGSFNQIELHYSGANPSDLDLYLYSENYIYEDASTILRVSQRSYPEDAGRGYETIDLRGLAPGVYMINVRVNTNHLGQVANYYLTTSAGTRFCQ